MTAEAAAAEPTSHHLGNPVRLGKASPRHDHRTLRLARYLPTSLPPPPAACDWSTKAAPQWGMMENDTLGDCTCAAMGHGIQAWTAANGSELTLTDADILAAYEGACGYVPGDASTDNGGVELDVLNYWRQTGVGGHKVVAYAALEPKNRQHVEQAVFLFGGCYIGVSLPLSAQNQTDWTVAEGGDQGDPTPGSWGGHAVFVVGYDADWVYFVSWGQKMRMSWAFWNAYCDESYAVLSADWCESDKAPSLVDMAQLQADLMQVTDPASSSDPATAAAAGAARHAKAARLRAGTVTEEDTALRVTTHLFDSGGEVSAENDAGVQLGVTLAAFKDEHGDVDRSRSIVALRLLVGGKGHVVQFTAEEIGEFVEAVGSMATQVAKKLREQPQQQPVEPPAPPADPPAQVTPPAPDPATPVTPEPATTEPDAEAPETTA